MKISEYQGLEPYNNNNNNTLFNVGHTLSSRLVYS